MKKFLATLLLIAAAFTMSACDNSDDNVSGDPGAGGNPGISFTATVTEYNKNGKFFIASVTSGENMYPEYHVKLAGNTVYIYDGREVSRNYIAAGATVKVTYNGVSTRSLPPQITAARIEILSLPAESAATDPTQSVRSSGSGEVFSMYATVRTVGESIAVDVTESATAQGAYVLHVSPATEITDFAGNELSLSDISAGDSLYVEYGGAVTLSLPPQTTATKIVVIK